MFRKQLINDDLIKMTFDKKSIKNQLVLLILVTFFNPIVPTIKKPVS